MKILYATDGSEGALAAGRFLGVLPHQADAHVHIVTVTRGNDTAGDAHCQAARTALGGFPAQVTTAETPGDTTSDAVIAILSTATALDADLIVLGACGSSALARFFLGSVADGVVRHAERPVLLARPFADGEASLKCAVIGVDGSPASRAAAESVVSWFPLPSDCRLHMVAVVQPPSWILYGGDPTSASNPPQDIVSTLELSIDAQTRHAHTCLKSLTDTLHGRAMDTEVRVGNPADELIRAAEEVQAGLIVVGSHGLTGIDRFLLGSVSERVVRHAPCSVLVVR